MLQRFEISSLNSITNLRAKTKKFLLRVDNCPAHTEIGGLKPIELCFLPLNTTSITQRMDKGVIQLLKVKQRSRMFQK